MATRISLSMLEIPRQFARFTGVGFISAFGHFGVLIVLVQGLEAEPVRASVAGALVGGWINYAMNYRYTFRSQVRHRESVAKFTVVAAVGLLLNTVFMWLGVHVLAAHYLFSQVLTTVLVLVWSFGANRLWTFRA